MDVDMLSNPNERELTPDERREFYKNSALRALSWIGARADISSRDEDYTIFSNAMIELRACIETLFDPRVFKTSEELND